MVPNRAHVADHATHVQPKQPRMTQDDLDTIKDMRQQGFKPAEIAGAIGFSESAVKKRIWPGKREQGAGKRNGNDHDGDPGGVTPPSTPPLPMDDSEPPANDEAWGPSAFGMYGGEFHQLFDQVLKVLQCPKDKRRVAVNMVRLNPQYHSEEQLRSLLHDLKVPGPMAVRAGQMTMSMYNQQSVGYNSPLSQFGPVPPTPGQVPPVSGYVPSYPAPPGYPGHGNGQPVAPMPPWGWYGSPPHSRDGEKDPDSMTMAEAQQMIQQEVEKIREKDALTGKISQLIQHVAKLEDRIESGGGMMEVPATEGGRVLTTEDGQVVYQRVPVSMAPSPGTSLEERAFQVMESALNRVMEIRSQPSSEGMTKNDKALIREQNKNDLLVLRNEVEGTLGGLLRENDRLNDRLQNDRGSGLSEDGHVAIAEIQQRGAQIQEGIKLANTTLGNIFTTFNRAMQVEEPPPGYNQVQQWTNQEAQVAASRFMDG